MVTLRKAVETSYEINDIVNEGDLARISEVKEWLDKWSFFTGDISIPLDLRQLLVNSDGATLHSLTKLPKFYILSRPLIKCLRGWRPEDNPNFFRKLRDALLPHLG